ncbi:tetratricopeptide repeat protein [Thermodesulfobacteriota bacterium]
MNRLNTSQINTENPIEWVSFWKSKKNILALSAILIISFMVYLPSLQNGFVNWDDQINIYENPNIINISNWESFIASAKAIFATHVMGNYNPLAILSFAFEKMLFGLDRPEWMHLNNIILHLICVLLVFRVALTLGLKIIPAAFCALLFGIHPMRVESVAWITERKDVLFGAFYLFALYYYIKSVKLSFQKHYSVIILLSFILALLSKIQAVAFPLSMLLVDYYFDRPLSMKLLYEKWHYFFLSLATGIVGIYFLRVDGGIENNNLFSFFERVFIGSYAYIIFIIKSVFPYKLVPVYSYPAEITWVFYASIVPVLFVSGLVCYFFIKKRKELVFGLLFFTFNIMFLLQILGAGQGFLADRFTYIAYLGLFFICAYGFQCAVEKYKRSSRVVYLVALLILGIFGFMNFEQNKIWKNGETLWTHVLKHNPLTSLAWENRADYYSETGRIQEAIDDFTRAISLKPDNPIAYYSRANLFHYNKPDPDTLRLALYDYTQAIHLSPGTAEYFIQRGIAYFKLNMFENALQDLITAERLNPADQNIYSYRSSIYINLGQYDKAQPDLEKYLSLNPYEPVMWSNLGVLTRMKKQYMNSLNAFAKAIQLAPGKLDYYYKRSKTYFEMGEIQKARNDLDFLKSKGFRGIEPDYERKIYQGK